MLNSTVMCEFGTVGTPLRRAAPAVPKLAAEPTTYMTKLVLHRDLEVCNELERFAFFFVSIF